MLTHKKKKNGSLSGGLTLLSFIYFYHECGNRDKWTPFFFFFLMLQVNPIEKHEWRWMFYDIVIPQRCLRIPV